MLGLLVLTDCTKHATHGSVLESSSAVMECLCGIRISHKSSETRERVDARASGTSFSLEQ